MDDYAPLAVIDEQRAGVVLQSPDRSALIRITARLGVWGLLAGLTPILAAAFDVGIPLWFGIPLMGVGLIVSGAGTALASGCVLKALKGRSVLLRAASVAGIPLGISVGLFGVAQLLRWSSLVRSLDTIAPTVIVLGVVVMVSLVVSFFIDWGHGNEQDRGLA